VCVFDVGKIFAWFGTPSRVFLLLGSWIFGEFFFETFFPVHVGRTNLNTFVEVEGRDVEIINLLMILLSGAFNIGIHEAVCSLLLWGP